MSKKTPAEVAAERYQMPQEANSGFDWYDDECDKVRRKRQGYADCYTERTLPLLARIEELEASNASLIEECHQMAAQLVTDDDLGPRRDLAETDDFADPLNGGFSDESDPSLQVATPTRTPTT